MLFVYINITLCLVKANATQLLFSLMGPIFFLVNGTRVQSKQKQGEFKLKSWKLKQKTRRTFLFLFRLDLDFYLYQKYNSFKITCELPKLSLIFSLKPVDLL